MSEQIIFDDEISVDFRGWEWVDFDASAGDVLHIVARETDRYDFDLFIVPSEDVNDSDFYTEHALFSKEYETYFRGKYKFKTSGSFALIISNYRAQSIARDVYLKLTLKSPEKKEQKAEEKEIKKQVKQTQKKQKKDTDEKPQSVTSSESINNGQSLSLKGIFIILIIILASVASSLVLWFIHPFLGGALMTVIGGLLFGVFRNDVRNLIIKK